LQRVGCGVVFQLTPGSGGWTESVLYAFSGTDGALPSGNLTLDAAGNVYGLTLTGGNLTLCSATPEPGCGVVFKLTNSGGTWTESVIHLFSGTDGDYPDAGLVFHNGELYGTTSGGGSGGFGTVFKVTPQHGGWVETVLASFASGSDGNLPHGNVTFDSAGNLYGTTYEGGGTSCNSGQGCGTVFELINQNGTWAKSILYRFSGGIDGAGPEGAITVDNFGRLYGTASNGGKNGAGVVFQVMK
jgi:uncharacterized repeat protein (TIGR03803 family)